MIVKILIALSIGYLIGVGSLLAVISYMSKKEDAETNLPNLKK